MNVTIFLDYTKVRSILENHFGNCCLRMSRALNIDNGQLHHFLNGRKGAGGKVALALWQWCEDNKLNFKDYLTREEY